MTTFAKSMVSNELADCVSSGRAPTIGELFQQAESMWIVGAVGRSALEWRRLAPDSQARALALRSAHLALVGSLDP